MRYAIRSFVFAYISVYITQAYVDGFDFGTAFVSSFLLVVIAIALLNMFMIPILKLVSVPSTGIFYAAMSFLLTLLVLYLMTVFIPAFEIKNTTLREVVIPGFTFSAKTLTIYWSLIVSSVFVSSIVNFLVWLCGCKK